MGTSLVIHVGLHKTGSSSIQQTLFQRRLRGVDYLHFGIANSSHPLKLIFEPDLEKQAAHYAQVTGDEVTPDGVAEMRAELEQCTDMCRSPLAVLSAESIPLFSEPALLALRDFALTKFEDVSVIGYVRPPVSYVQSRFQHGVRTARKRDFEVGVGYRGRLRKLDAVFGRDKVTLVKFDRAELFQGDVVKDFVNRLGSSIAWDDIITLNESLSLEALALLYVRNVRGQQSISPRRARVLSESLAHLGERKLCFGANFLQPLLERKADEIRWTENRLGRPFLDSAKASPDCISSEDQLFAIALAQADQLEEVVSSAVLASAENSAYRKTFDRLSSKPKDLDRVAGMLDLLGAVLAP